MGSIRKTTSVHEKTVQKVSQNAILISKVTKPRKKATRSRNSAVKTRHYLDEVDPLIVAWIRENRIFYKRVEVVSPTRVIIHNPGEKWEN